MKNAVMKNDSYRIESDKNASVWRVTYKDGTIKEALGTDAFAPISSSQMYKSLEWGSAIPKYGVTRVERSQIKGDHTFVESLHGRQVAPAGHMTRIELKAKFIELHVLDSARKTQRRFLQPLGLWDDLYEQTSWMKHSALSDVSKRIRWIVSDNPPNPPACKVCQKNACSWDGYKFAEWCSVPCKNKDPDVRAVISVKNHLNKDSRMAKREATTLERYGVKHVMQIKSVSTEANINRRSTMMELYGPDPAAFWYNQVAMNHGGVHPINNCAHYKTSKGEQEMFDALVAMGLTPESIVQNDRKVLGGKELDLLIPSSNLAIEYCGLLWHSEWANSRKDDLLHMHHKMIGTQSNDLQLVTIYDTDWINRREQILNLLRSKLHLNAVSIGARKCTVRQIESGEARDFIEQNHIQPSHINPFSYGLFYKDELVSVMAFRVHHRNNKQIVLSRFCTKSGITIAGGASKLLKYAVDTNHWDEVISWSDNRWSDGNLYKKLGFVKEADLPPDYSYVKNGNQIVAKQACTKKKLGAAPGQTEHERALELGLFRIYDCGKVRWAWHRA